MYFCLLAVIGIVLNVWLYLDDIKNRNSILNRLDKGETIEDLTTSPVGTERRKFDDGDVHGDDMQMNMAGDENLKQAAQRQKDQKDMDAAAKTDAELKANLLDYKENKELRDSLRRSYAKQAMSQQH